MISSTHSSSSWRQWAQLSGSPQLSERKTYIDWMTSHSCPRSFTSEPPATRRPLASQTSDSKEEADQGYAEDTSAFNSSVGVGFQRYGQKCSDGRYCAALPQQATTALWDGFKYLVSTDVEVSLRYRTPLHVKSFLPSKFRYRASPKCVNINFWLAISDGSIPSSVYCLLGSNAGPMLVPGDNVPQKLSHYLR